MFIKIYNEFDLVMTIEESVHNMLYLLSLHDIEFPNQSSRL